MTTIKIRDLEIFANHGVLREENVLGQKFVVSIELDVPTTGRDSLEDTVDYGDVCAFAEEFLRKKTYKLIETAASSLAKRLILKFPKAARASAEIKKPWAPVKAHMGCVSAKAEAVWHKAYISVGSNMGDRRQHVNRAKDELDKNKYCRVIRTAPLIETKPVGYTDQNDFLNGCIELETLLEPFELLDLLHRLEDEDGRTHEIHWGPRTIDLDIIFYDDIVLTSEELTIPHREMANRYFVLKPLCDLAPHMRHPSDGRTVARLLEEVCRNGEIG